MRTKAKCGTISGYVTHNARGGKPCKNCKRAWAAYYRKPGLKPRVKAECGTSGGYAKHAREGTLDNAGACGCRFAWAYYNRQRRRGFRGAEWPGYDAHG